MSTAATPNAWKEREKHARVLASLVAQQRKIRERMLRYRAEEARPDDRKGLLPQEVAAGRADVSARQWQRWETGETVPHASNIEKLAKNLSIPVAEFYADAPTADTTPDLMGTMDGVPENLQQQLDDIKEKLDQLLVLSQIAAAEHHEETAETAPQSDTRSTRPATPAAPRSRPRAS